MSRGWSGGRILVGMLALHALRSVTGCGGRVDQAGPPSADGPHDTSASGGPTNRGGGPPPGTTGATTPPSPTTTTPPSPSCPGCVAKVAAIADAFAVACGATTIYVGSTTGDLFRVQRDSTSAQPILPKAGGALGFLATDDTHLFYTLPDAGELHRRDLATGLDVRLAKSLATPQGVALHGDTILVASSDGVQEVSSDGADQTPTVRVPFGAGAGILPAGIAVQDSWLLVFEPTRTSGDVAMFTTSGTSISDISVFGPPYAATVRGSQMYWTVGHATEIAVSPFPATLPWSSKPFVEHQVLIGGVCLQQDRLYFSALSDDATTRELRYAYAP
jgi:hypothetical protein